jgi:CRISPR system Cascade subunit CasD
LKNPKWVIGLGRKSYVPVEPVYLKDGLKENTTLKEALAVYPFIGRGNKPESILCSFETTDGSGRMVMDQLLSSFAARRFGSRFVVSEHLTLNKEGANVST